MSSQKRSGKTWNPAAPAERAEVRIAPGYDMRRVAGTTVRPGWLEEKDHRHPIALAWPAAEPLNYEGPEYSRSDD